MICFILFPRDNMVSEEVGAVAPWRPNEDENDAVSPQVGLFVTADVRVVQYNSSDSLGE